MYVAETKDADQLRCYSADDTNVCAFILAYT